MLRWNPMPPLPSWLARFNRRVTNRLTMPVARRIPGFAVLIHTGRRSGRRYRTPVNLFPSEDTFVIALTYGRDRDWVKNVLAAGTCDVEYRGASVHLTEPRIITDRRGHGVPGPVRLVLATFGVTEFMELKPDRSRG